MFKGVKLVRDIRIASFIDRKQLKRGEPDMYLVSPLGFNTRVRRRDLTRKFVDTSGKKIRLRMWRYNRKYLVLRSSEIKMRALRVPKGADTVIVVNGREVAGGSYIICEVKKDGSVAKNNGAVLKEEMFNRMFELDTEQYIDRNYLRKKSRNSLGKDVASNKRKDKVDIEYKVVRRIINKGTGKVVGFVVTDGRTTRDLTMSQVMDLCRLKRLSNITIVSKDGKEFLRGVNMRISNLPAIEV